MSIIHKIKDKFNLLKIMLKQKEEISKLNGEIKILEHTVENQHSRNLQLNQTIDGLKITNIVIKSNNDILEEKVINLELGVKNLTTYNNKLLDSLEEYRKAHYENGNNGKN